MGVGGALEGEQMRTAEWTAITNERIEKYVFQTVLVTVINIKKAVLSAGLILSEE